MGPAISFFKIDLHPKCSQKHTSIPVVLFCMLNSKFTSIQGFYLVLFARIKRDPPVQCIVLRFVDRDQMHSRICSFGPTWTAEQGHEHSRLVVRKPSGIALRTTVHTRAWFECQYLRTESPNVWAGNSVFPVLYKDKQFRWMLESLRQNLGVKSTNRQILVRVAQTFKSEGATSRFILEEKIVKPHSHLHGFFSQRQIQGVGIPTFLLRDRTHKSNRIWIEFIKNIKFLHTCEKFVRICSRCKKNPRKCELENPRWSEGSPVWGSFWRKISALLHTSTPCHMFSHWYRKKAPPLWGIDHALRIITLLEPTGASNQSVNPDIFIQPLMCVYFQFKHAWVTRVYRTRTLNTNWSCKVASSMAFWTMALISVEDARQCWQVGGCLCDGQTDKHSRKKAPKQQTNAGEQKNMISGVQLNLELFETALFPLSSPPHRNFSFPGFRVG